MYLDIASLLTRVDGLEHLEAPFTREEIDRIISELPNHKSPRPHGFNGEFLKKCWPIIAQGFYDLCDSFVEGNICLRSINGSYIVLILIPKKDTPLFIGDYRPISLLNSSIKLITKLLSQRLQEVIISLIHVNEYGFIKSRTIHAGVLPPSPQVGYTHGG